MGFIESSQNKEWWRVAQGKLNKKCEPTEPGATPYVPEKGKFAGQTCYRTFRNGYCGIITGIEFLVPKNPVYPMELGIEFDNRIMICVRASGTYLTRFAGVCEKIDIGNDVCCIPWSMQSEKDPTKTFAGWTWKQNGTKIEPEPEMCTNTPECILPEPQQIRVNGKMVMDWTERDQFLIDHIATWARGKKIFIEQRSDSTHEEEGGML
mgnify:CR=1 FL=1